MKKKILAIPHIGTAFGHFYRLATFLDDFIDEYNIFILIPEPYFDYCKRFLHPDITLIPRLVHCSISGSTGLIDMEGYKSLLKENEKIYHIIKPDLIIGDPGIQAAILATKYSRPWIGLMHGCYLPFPDKIQMNEQLYTLLRNVWCVLNDQMNKLISLGTNKVYTSWSEIQKTGKIIIPNFSKNEPSSIGEYQDINSKIKSAWDVQNEVDLLITCCSAGTISPTDTFLTNLNRVSNKNVFVAGIKAKTNQSNIFYLGNNVNYRSLVHENTIVITHGGHGTLQAINKAKKVFMIPSDFDQLYNSIIASSIKGWKLVFDKNWFEIVNSDLLFKREIHWENLVFETLNGEIELKGLDIYQKQDIFESQFHSDSVTCI